MNWNLTTLFKDLNDWKEQSESFQSKIIVQLKFIPADQEHIKDMILFLENSYADLDVFYTYSLLFYDINIGTASGDHALEMGIALYDWFDQQIEPIQIWIQENIDEVIEQCKLKNELKVYLPYYMTYKKEIIDGGSSDSTLASLRSSLHIEETFKKIENELFEEDILHEGNIVTLTNENLLPLLMTKDSSLRKKAYLTILKSLESKKDQAAFLLNAYFQFENTKAKLADFKNAYHAAVHQLFPDGNNPFEDLHAKYQKIFHQIVTTKAKILKMESISYYDLYALSNEFEMTFTIEEAKSIILNAVKPLGSQYVQDVEEIFNEGWIDWKPRKNYKQANEKIMDLYDNYSRAETLVIDTLNKMMQADQEIAEQIIAKLGV